MTSIFISYSRQDFNFAKALYDELTAQGHQPWLDLIDLKPGEDWAKALSTAIIACDCFIVLASPWSVGAPNRYGSSIVRREWVEARQHQKPVLVLVIQSLHRDDLASIAKEDVLKDSSWIDIRAEPLAATQSVLSWIANPQVAQTGPLPQERRFFFLNVIPRVAHVTALSVIGGALLTLAIYSAMLIWVVLARMDPFDFTVIGTFFEQFLIVTCVVFAIGGCFLAVITLRTGIFAYTRRHNKQLDVLLSIGRLHLEFGTILSLSQAGEALYQYRNLGFRSGEIDLNSGALIFGGMSLFLALVTYLFYRLVKNSAVLARWQPAYISTGKKKIPPRGDEAQAETQHQTLATIDSDATILNVGLLYAAPDANFAVMLEETLGAAEVVVSTINAGYQDCKALIVILTEFLLADQQLTHQWQQAQEDSIPIIPVLLEQTGAELPLNWIDAQSDLHRACEEVVSVLQDQHSLAKQISDLAAPMRRGSTLTPWPDAMNRYHLWSAIMLSSVIKMIIAAFFTPLALQTVTDRSSFLYVAVVLLFLIGWLQLLSLAALLSRRISRQLLIEVNAFCILAGGISFLPIAPIVGRAFSVGDGSVSFIFMGIVEILVLFVIVKTPMLREWALGGRTVIFRFKRETNFYSLYAPLAILVIGALFWFLILFSGDSTIKSEGTYVVYGQPVEFRIAEGKYTEREWVFNGNQNDIVRVSLRVLGGSPSHFNLVLKASELKGVAELEVLVAYSAREEGQDYIILPDYRLANHGVYGVEIAGDGGQYQLTIDKVGEENSSIACGDILSGLVAEDVFWTEWYFDSQIDAEVLLTLDWLDSKPRLRVFDADNQLIADTYGLDSPSGMPFEGDSSGSLHEAWLRFDPESNTTYTILAGGYPIYEGDFVFSLQCPD